MENCSSCKDPVGDMPYRTYGRIFTICFRCDRSALRVLPGQGWLGLWVNEDNTMLIRPVVGWEEQFGESGGWKAIFAHDSYGKGRAGVIHEYSDLDQPEMLVQEGKLPSPEEWKVVADKFQKDLKEENNRYEARLAREREEAKERAKNSTMGSFRGLFGPAPSSSPAPSSPAPSPQSSAQPSSTK